MGKLEVNSKIYKICLFNKVQEKIDFPINLLKNQQTCLSREIFRKPLFLKLIYPFYITLIELFYVASTSYSLHSLYR